MEHFFIPLTSEQEQWADEAAKDQNSIWNFPLTKITC